MPFINTVTTKKISASEEAELRCAFGKAIELIPGKSEEWLMLKFVDEARMSFKGDASSDCAMVEIDILGRGRDCDFKALAKELINTLNRIIDVPKDRIYVKFGEYEYWYGAWNID